MLRVNCFAFEHACFYRTQFYDAIGDVANDDIVVSDVFVGVCVDVKFES